MVGLSGHLALALLFALPAWILWDGRTDRAYSTGLSKPEGFAMVGESATERT